MRKFIFMEYDIIVIKLFIGDTITANAEVMSNHETKLDTELKISVKRQTGETVLEGEAWCYTFSNENKNF